MVDDSSEEIVRLFKENQSFLVTSHIRADGDAVGSMCALTLALRKLGKTVYPVLDSVIPTRYAFLSDECRIAFSKDTESLPETDVFVLLDCASLERIRDVQRFLADMEKTAVIDHHVSNENFANVNLVDPHACSTGEILYDVIKKLGVEISGSIAEAIFTAVVTDTGRFSFENTTANAFTLTGRMVEDGLNVAAACRKIYADYPENILRLQAMTLDSIERFEGGRIATMLLTREMFEKTGAVRADVPDFIDILKDMGEIDIAILFNEVAEGEIKLSFRSRDVNVDKLAAEFGGGGHMRAAGAQVKGSVEDVKKTVVETVRRELYGAAKA